jgi:hypothetical protein
MGEFVAVPVAGRCRLHDSQLKRRAHLRHVVSAGRLLLDAEGNVTREVLGVGACRALSCRDADSVLEIHRRAGE